MQGEGTPERHGNGNGDLTTEDTEEHREQLRRRKATAGGDQKSSNRGWPGISKRPGKAATATAIYHRGHGGTQRTAKDGDGNGRRRPERQQPRPAWNLKTPCQSRNGNGNLPQRAQRNTENGKGRQRTGHRKAATTEDCDGNMLRSRARLIKARRYY
jgi:hypothetical protein